MVMLHTKQYQAMLLEKLNDFRLGENLKNQI